MNSANSILSVLKALIERNEVSVADLVLNQTVAVERAVLEVTEVDVAERVVAVLVLISREGLEVRAKDKPKPETRNFHSLNRL